MNSNWGGRLRELSESIGRFDSLLLSSNVAGYRYHSSIRPLLFSQVSSRNTDCIRI